MKRGFFVFGGVLFIIGLYGILFLSSSIFFGFLTASTFLIIYGFIVRREIPYVTRTALSTHDIHQTALCPRCGITLESDWVYCPSCKERLK